MSTSDFERDSKMGGGAADTQLEPDRAKAGTITRGMEVGGVWCVSAGKAPQPFGNFRNKVLKTKTRRSSKLLLPCPAWPVLRSLLPGTERQTAFGPWTEQQENRRELWQVSACPCVGAKEGSAGCSPAANPSTRLRPRDKARDGRPHGWHWDNFADTC